MRRKVGVSAVKKKQEEANQYSKVGKALESNKISAVTEVMSKFRTTLTDFAMKHRGKYIATKHHCYQSKTII